MARSSVAGLRRDLRREMTARRLGDDSSEPVTTALSQAPETTLRKPHFNVPDARAADAARADDVARRTIELGVHHAGVAGMT